MSKISERLKKQREALNMSISQTAEAAGLSDSSLSRFERGVFKSISVEHLEAWASALNMDMAELFDDQKPFITRGQNTTELIKWLDEMPTEKREHTSKLLLELLRDNDK